MTQNLIFLINTGMIIVPEISLPTKGAFLTKECKKGFCNNLNVKKITDNRKLGKLSNQILAARLSKTIE